MGRLTIEPNLVILDNQSNERNEVLKLLSLKLEENGYVKPTFYDSLLAREEEYPTGISGRYTNFAVPHTTAEHVNSSAIAIAICKNGINFRSMENPDDTLECKVVSMLAFHDSLEHLDALRSLIKLMNSEDVPSLIDRGANNIKIAAMLNNRLSDLAL